MTSADAPAEGGDGAHRAHVGSKLRRFLENRVDPGMIDPIVEDYVATCICDLLNSGNLYSSDLVELLALFLPGFTERDDALRQAEALCDDIVLQQQPHSPPQAPASAVALSGAIHVTPVPSPSPPATAVLGAATASTLHVARGAPAVETTVPHAVPATAAKAQKVVKVSKPRVADVRPTCVDEDVEGLCAMFPRLLKNEVARVHGECGGDLDVCVEALIAISADRQEAEQQATSQGAGEWTTAGRRGGAARSRQKCERRDSESSNGSDKDKEKGDHRPCNTPISSEGSKGKRCTSEGMDDTSAPVVQGRPIDSADGRADSKGADASVMLLQEMYPNIGADTIGEYLRMSGGDVAACAERLLLLAESLPQPRARSSSKNEVDLDKSMRDMIVNRYALQEFDPANPNPAPARIDTERVWKNDKKMVRYRENRVVSTRGERISYEPVNRVEKLAAMRAAADKENAPGT